MRYVFAFVLSIMLLLLPAGPASAEDGHADSQILFLQLTFNQSDVTLTKSTIVPGFLKELRVPEAREIRYEVTVGSEVVFEGAIDNPLVQRFEYEDPNEPGRLQMKVVELDEATVTIRVPNRDNLKEMTFFRTVAGKAAGDQPTREIIGSVDLSGIGGER